MANGVGGYSYPVDDWARLRRFLVLGSEGGMLDVVGFDTAVPQVMRDFSAAAL